MRRIRFLIVLTAAGAVMAGCSGPETKPIAGNTAQPAANVPAAGPSVPPGAAPDGSPNAKPAKLSLKAPLKNVTAADIAKIKWLNGSFRGTGGAKPFFNTYAWSGTTLNIASYDDEALTKYMDKATYELKNGTFANPSGKDQFAASEIGEDAVEFVTLTEKAAIIRYERVGDGTLKVVFEFAGDDGNPNRVSYTMEPLKK